MVMLDAENLMTIAEAAQRYSKLTRDQLMAACRREELPHYKIGRKREQRQLWLGHLSQDTTAHYEINDPDYLRECAQATDLIIEKIGALTKRALWPAGGQGELGLKVVKGGKG